MATATKGSTGRKSSNVKSANFESKNQREARRKHLVSQKTGIRGKAANVVAEKRLSAKERAEFYRNLREIKMRRRQIAKHMSSLERMVEGLQSDIIHIRDRYDGLDESKIDEALALTKKANAAVGVASGEFYVFARRRVFFTEYVEAGGKAS